MKNTVPDRKSTRLNSSHLVISYAVFCLKKKKTDSNDIGCSFGVGTWEVQDLPSLLSGQCLQTQREVDLYYSFFFLMIRPPPSSTLFPYPPLFRSVCPGSAWWPPLWPSLWCWPAGYGQPS